MEQLFKPKIDLNKDPHLVEYFKRAKDFNPLEHYNIDEVDFQKWVEENFFEHLKPIDKKKAVSGGYSFVEAFYIREGSDRFTDKDAAIKTNIIFRLLADIKPECLIKTLEHQVLSDEENDYMNAAIEAYESIDLQYIYGIPVLTMYNQSDLVKKAFASFSGIVIHNMGIVLNCKDERSNEYALRHEMTHLIQNYKNSCYDTAIENVKEGKYEEIILNKLKKEFEAYITRYDITKKVFSGRNTYKRIINAIMGPVFSPSKLFNSKGEKYSDNPKNQELLIKAKNIIKALENIVPQASPDKLVEINEFIQNADTLDELLGFDSNGEYVKKGLLQFL